MIIELAYFHGFLLLFSHTRILFVVSQSVKEVLQSLVDDNLVQMDKIGSSNCRCSSIDHPGHIQRRMRACAGRTGQSSGASLLSGVRSYVFLFIVIRA